MHLGQFAGEDRLPVAQNRLHIVEQVLEI
jgi:hypothetical protein